MMDFILSIYYFSLGAFIGSIPIAIFMVWVNDYRTFKIMSAWGLFNLMIVMIGLLKGL